MTTLRKKLVVINSFFPLSLLLFLLVVSKLVYGISVRTVFFPGGNPATTNNNADCPIFSASQVPLPATFATKPTTSTSNHNHNNDPAIIDSLAQSTPTRPSSSSSSVAVIFIHGRLEPDVGDIPPPCELYGDFCSSLAQRIPVAPYAAKSQERMQSQQQQNESSSPLSPPPSGVLLLLEFDKLLLSQSRLLAEESRSLALGPISWPIVKAIEQELQLVGKKLDGQFSFPKITLITFSMGAAIGLKLLVNQESWMIRNVIDKVILIAPVWRCWIPFDALERRISSCPTTDTDNNNNVHRRIPPVLALYGTKDDETRIDSGRNVQASLRSFFAKTQPNHNPTITTIPLEGGTHWSILSESSITKMLDEEDGQNLVKEVNKGYDGSRTRSQIQQEMIYHIAKFCEWE